MTIAKLMVIIGAFALMFAIARLLGANGMLWTTLVDGALFGAIIQWARTGRGAIGGAIGGSLGPLLVFWVDFASLVSSLVSATDVLQLLLFAPSVMGWCAVMGGLIGWWFQSIANAIVRNRATHDPADERQTLPGSRGPG